MNYIKYKIPFPLIDIFFIIWKPKCISKIHNHSKNGCYMFIIKGDIREEIFNKVWGTDVIVGNRTIDVHIRKLREKIGDNYIKTIKGIGYKFEF